MNGLILNLGLKSIRAIIFDRDGKVLASAYRRIHTFLNKDCVEQDPNTWWHEGMVCINEVLSQNNDIDFITVTASAACLIPVNVKGDSLTKAIMVSDKRAQEEAAYINNLESFQSLSYKCDPTLMLPKILWLKNNRSEIYAKTHKFLSPNDYFLYRMTGKFVIDELNATKFFTAQNKYPEALLKELGIDLELLPDIKPTGYALETSDAFLNEVNLEKKVPILITTYDAICALFGACTTERGDVCDMSGTVTSLRMLSTKDLKPGEKRIFSQQLNGRNIIGGSNNLGGGLIEWLLQTFYTENEYEKLELLRDCHSAKTGLVFLPYLLGERAPLWDNSVRGAFLGIEHFHSKQDMARAVLESTAYILKHLVEVMEENELPVSTIYVSGGLSKIDLVNQIKADVTGKRVCRVKETEASALGAYILARESLDPNFDSENFIEIEKVYTPNSSVFESYANAYELFKYAYLNLKDFHQKREEMLISNEMQRSNL